MQLSEGAKRSELHPDYAAIGLMHEEMHERENPTAQREVPFKRQVTDNAVLSGRADFVFDDHIDECKATFSDTTFRNAKSGKPEMSHLTQLVCYMMEFGKSRGRLIYGYFVKGKDGQLKRKDTAIIEVQRSDERLIYVNGASTGYTDMDLINSIMQIAHWKPLDVPAPRPAAQGYNSACRYCPLKELCDRIDDQELFISDVKAEAIELIEAKVGPTPKPKVEK